MANFFQKKDISWIDPNKYTEYINKNIKLEGEYSTQPIYDICGHKNDTPDLHHSNRPFCRCDYPTDFPGEPCKHCPHIHQHSKIENISCLLAYYESYNSDKSKKAKIVFHRNNIKQVYNSITDFPSYRSGDFERLWIIMTNCILYHELGHHLVQLFTENPKINRIPLYDEQKLCEYIAFKKTYEILTKKIQFDYWFSWTSPAIPQRYTNKTHLNNPFFIPIKFRSRSISNAFSYDSYDIGSSQIYQTIPLADYYGPPSAPRYNQTNKKSKDILNLILCAFGGRGKGEQYYPEITKHTRKMIKSDPVSWNYLFEILFNDNDNKRAPKNISTHIIPKTRIVSNSKLPKPKPESKPKSQEVSVAVAPNLGKIKMF